jgi:DNA invertase Pin-like site-specific DNA recombinase
MTSDLVTPRHLCRKAVIYIRQSSPHQVLSNQESLRLQYALRQRARELGWHEADTEVIDADLGLSGAAADHRAGFKDLIARVTLGEVGLIISSEVTRLARNCSDWSPLLDLCGYRDCLIGDRDGIYDPGSPNGRLLLGLKGTISEVELHTLRGRLTAGLLNKAERGELALALPVGLVRDPSGVVTKDPDQEVQARIDLVFATFLERRSAAQVLRVLNARGLGLPRRDRFGDLTWTPPTVSRIVAMLHNPAYAGAFVYGRTRTLGTSLPGRRPVQERRRPDEWRILVKNKYPAYIDWATFEQVQARLHDNRADYDRNQTRGVPRNGAALLHGIAFCGACGHKMVVQYKGTPRYICNHLRQQHGVPVCQYLPAGPIDVRVVAAFFDAVTPAELDAWTRAQAAEQQGEEALDRAEAQQIERLGYQAALAERQFHRVDPDNRLVAAELERRWEAALRELRQAEEAFARRTAARARPVALSPELRAAFLSLGRRLPDLWADQRLTRARKTALLRCLIDKVVLHRLAPDRIAVRLVWRGGETSALEVETTVGALSDLSRGTEMEACILALARAGVDDATVAARLTLEGHRSPLRHHVLPSTVRAIRLCHGLLVKHHQSHPRRIAGCLTVPQLADRLAVKRHWLYDRIHNGTIAIARDERTGLYLFPDTADTLAGLAHLRDGELDRLQVTPPPVGS